MQELQKLTEAARDLIATCEVMRGRHPEEDDILTHELWAEAGLHEALKSASALLAKSIKEEA